MKITILLVGEWSHEVYERALADGFERLGHKVVQVASSRYLGYTLVDRIEHKTLFGPGTWRFNRAILAIAREHSPDFVLMRRPVNVFESTVLKLRQMLPGVPVVTYNNDNPFCDGRRWRLWRRYFSVARRADWNYFYRPDDIRLAHDEGIPQPQVLLPWYVEGLHCSPKQPVKIRRDVVFVGHWEADGRDQTLNRLWAAGIDLDVFGTRWERSDVHFRDRVHGPVYGESYVKTIWESRISLVFLSARNVDVYTRRCFEIPACGGFMLAPRTSALIEMFSEDREAVYYRDRPELDGKLEHYLTHDTERMSIAESGLERVLAGSHSNFDRASQIMRDAQSWRQNSRTVEASWVSSK